MTHVTQAREPRDAAGAPLPPPVLVAFVIAAGVALWFIAPLALPRGVSAAALAAPFAAAAVALLAWSARTLRHAHTAVIPYHETTSLVTSGPYRFTRNPIYLAFLVAQAALAFALSNGWLLILLPVSWYLLDVVQVRREEQYLVRKFGEAYYAYARRVRRWI